MEIMLVFLFCSIACFALVMILILGGCEQSDKIETKGNIFRDKKIEDEWIKLMLSIIRDYDGILDEVDLTNKEENWFYIANKLKELLDECYDYGSKAIESDDYTEVFLSGERKFNILNEEIQEEEE